MSNLKWYPESELERHGLGPDEWHCEAVYALALSLPERLHTLRERWADHYAVPVPAPLERAVSASLAVVYVGATGDLLARLHDHVAGDVRRVTLLAVCPPTGIAAVWPEADAVSAETGYAMEYANANEGTICYANGDWF